MALPRSMAVLTLVLSLSMDVAIGDPTPPAEIRFGPEFTFSNLKVLLGNNGFVQWGDLDRVVLAKYAKWLTEYCAKGGECVVEAKFVDADTKLRAVSVEVLLEDGFTFSAKTDANVIEFATSPLTVKEWDAKTLLLDELIFRGMRNLGLEPQSLYGSGHVNIDKQSAFGGDVLRYRDFIVDFFNHPGLSDGILEADPFNARGLAELGETERRNFEKIVAKVDAGEIRTIDRFEAFIKRVVFRGNPFYKGYALRFHGNRLEIRSARAQSSVGHFADLARVFEGRIRRLAADRAKGEIVRIFPNVGANHGWQSVSQFYHYVTGAGVEWKAVGERLMPAGYRLFAGPLPLDATFARRLPCVYWLKDLRASAIEKIADAMGGIGK